jgi:protein-L-isoaspartate(D-aspartate) O-methyltransferase
MPATLITGDAVARAAAAVPREHYTDHPVHGRVPQATAQAAIMRDLRRAAITPRQRVLEIGTGTGLTGALLAELTGPDGHVVSLDIDPALTSRAAILHRERDAANITVLTRDGHHGAPEHGPYDAIIGWASPLRIPAAWTSQVRPGGVISTPVYLAEVARVVGHIHLTADSSHMLTEPQLGQAVYVDMGDTVNTEPGKPMFYIDAQASDANGTAFVSVAWRGQYPGHDPAATLSMLQRPGHTATFPLGDGEEERALAWRDFRAWAAARESAGPVSSLTYYGTTGIRWLSGIGFSSGSNAAVIIADGGVIASHPGSPALTKLQGYLSEWDQTGRSGLDAARPVLHQADDGWSVRTALCSR